MYGAERSLLTLATALRDRGRCEPAVLVPRRGPLLAALEAERIPTVFVRFHHWIGTGPRFPRAPAAALLNRFALLRTPRLVRALRPALVYTNSLATPFGAYLAGRLGLPHVWHAREFVEEDIGATFDRGLERSLRFVGRASARVVCNSRAVRRKLEPFVAGDALRVVYNGFPFDEDPSDFARPRDGPARLLIAGSIHPGKGQEDAIRALARLRADGRQVILEVAGSGRPREVARLRALAADLGVADAVEWPGFVDDVRARLAAARVALVCSRAEAFGRAAVEAMAAGTPVVVADAGGLPEIVTDGETGFTYPPGDAGALASAIARLLDDPAREEELVRAAHRSVASRFTVDACATGVEGILDEVLS
jgi:glycosyltransferase involved in cell wall biosynthesis